MGCSRTSSRIRTLSTIGALVLGDVEHLSKQLIDVSHEISFEHYSQYSEICLRKVDVYLSPALHFLI